MYNLVKYSICESFISVEDKGQCCTYGGYSLTYDEKGTLIETIKIPDISTNKKFVEEIIYLLEKHEVSVIHFRDVVEDMIL